MTSEQIIDHIKRLNPGEEDVLLIEGEPFFIRRASEEDIESVSESLKEGRKHEGD